MSSNALIFLLITSTVLLLAPRRLASIPLLVGACYMTMAESVSLGVFHFPLLRILIGVGVLRVIVRWERLAHGMNRLDWLMVIWAAWALISCSFHRDPTAQFVSILGQVYNACGIYFLIRVFCQSIRDVVTVGGVTAFLLVPVAAEMLLEVRTAHNLFSVFGAQPFPEIRGGRIRAQGPFAHAILAGTVGGVCLPMMVGLWRVRRWAAILGLTACLTMVVTSASSGPVATVLAALAGLLMWNWRYSMRRFRWRAVACYVALDIVMKAPPYFLLARIDLTGSSTGWHRAELIDSSLTHLNEWWLWGTDFTRHWMPTGVSWSPEHTDITNHYLHLGVIGGLPLMFLFIATLARAFAFIGQSIREKSPDTERFMVWTLGVSLFAHAASSMSISYFDQSFLFLYLNLAMIGSTWASLHGARSEQPQVLLTSLKAGPSFSLPRARRVNIGRAFVLKPKPSDRTSAPRPER